MLGRISEGEKSARALDRGKILVPKLLAQGFGTKVGDTVVVVATNKDGSVNGKPFLVSGILESATGPGGRDGYINFDDAREILRIPGKEVSEIAVSVKSLGRVEEGAQSIREGLGLGAKREKGAGIEVHTWSELSPFANIARMIDIMTFFIKLMLIAIVLISILNVMIMAVYERVREIGTIAAIGTLPRKILSLFLVEGFCLGLIGAVIGVLIGLGVIVALNLTKITFNFGQATGLVLAPTIAPVEVVTASLMVIAVSVLASLQPAYKASRMEPIEALRHV
jgi:putative ABC transport system permease protein